MSDRMFHVLVLGGMSLVGCGGSTVARSEPGLAAGDAASADAAVPLDAGIGLLDGSGSLDAGPHDGGVPTDAPLSTPDDAQAPGSGGDALGYADAAPVRREAGFPAEAPPQ